MGIVTTSSETAFARPPEIIYDFVTSPANWTKTYPGSARITDLPDELPLKISDTWHESGQDGDRIFTWHLAIATRPRLWMFNSVGRLGHDGQGNGGMEGRITVQYHFTQPGEDITLFTRTMTIEAHKTRTAARRVVPGSQPRQDRRLPRGDRTRIGCAR